MIFNSNQIQEIIPHRYPMQLVDRIDEMIPGKSIVGTKCISVNEMQFCGHFPEKHVMPGVLIIEALAQTGSVLLLSEEANKGKIGYFAGINKARFRQQVIPGDVLTLKVEVLQSRAGITFASAKAYVGDKLAVEAELMVGIQ
ncbi:MAG: 3-hydroxyacyl-ACP dehydratase FabZ [Erysipelotrichaceae bacterium]